MSSFTKQILEYIESQEPEISKRLLKIREVALRTLPGSEDAFGYGMPATKREKTILMYAVAKNHIGVYPTPEVIEFFSDELKKYKTSKGAVQFQNNEEIPYDLIEKMAKKRWEIIEREK